jgi:hypothetical protein
MRWVVPAAAALCLASQVAVAGPISDYITVQPVDVCGVTCAPINNLGAGHNIWSNAATGAVGFMSGGVNVTRAIWNQIGIDVTFMPAVGYTNSGFLTIPIASCSPLGTDCQSPVFQELSQQPAVSTGAVPNPTNPAGIPISKNATTINAFFIGSLRPPATQPGTLYGLAWINNNGVAIASNSLSGLGARADTLAHELGHNLDLDHTTLGAGVPPNLETAGNTRTLPSNANPLATLGTTTDQVNTGAGSQKARALLSGFLNPIPNVNTPVTDPPAKNDFNVSFAANTGRPGEKLDTLTLTAPGDFQFDPDTVFKLLSNPDGLSVKSSLTNCTDNDNDHDVDGCSSLVLDFTKGKSFVAGDSLDYSLCVKKWDYKCKAIAIDGLTGGTYTYNFETDSARNLPVELFQTTSELTGPGDLSSGSWFPDALIPSEILNPNTFLGFNKLGCTTDTTCPLLQLEDGSPLVEDKVPEPPTILILVSALAVLSVACGVSAHRSRSLEAGFAKPAPSC